MIDTLLARLGLTEDEITTYLTLLKLGTTGAGTLAKATGIVRATQYLFLKRLIEKGFVTQSQQAGLAQFTAESPRKLDHLYQEQLDALKRDRERYQTLLPSLLAQHTDQVRAPKFQIFEGRTGLKHVLKDLLLYRDTETQAYWPIKQMIELLGPTFFAEHNRERIKRNLYTRAIWPQEQAVSLKTHPYLGTGPKFKREIRIAPKDVNFTMGYWIYGDKVAFLSSSKESYGYILDSHELAEMLRSQFELAWKVSKPLKHRAEDTLAFLKTI